MSVNSSTIEKGFSGTLLGPYCRNIENAAFHVITDKTQQVGANG